MTKAKIITGLDIGSSKIAAVTVSCDKSGGFTVLGHATANSKGVLRGQIAELNEAITAVSAVVKMLKAKVAAGLGDVYVNISGESVKGCRSAGMIPLSLRGREITHFDMARCADAASTIRLPFDREIVHKIVHNYSVDDQPWIKNPHGLYASRLSCEAYIVTAGVGNIQNISKCVHSSGYDVKEAVFTGLADASAVLDKEDRDAGSILVNIGSGLTEISIFFDGILQEMDVLPLGTVDVKGDYKASDEFGRIAAHVGLKINNSQSNGKPVKSVVLTGGMAYADGVIEFLEERLKIPAKVGVAKEIRGDISSVDNLRLGTAIGLARYGCSRHEESRIRNKDLAGRISSTVVDIFNNYF